jgi:hypothetical protein
MLRVKISVAIQVVVLISLLGGGLLFYRGTLYDRLFSTIESGWYYLGLGVELLAFLASFFGDLLVRSRIDERKARAWSLGGLVLFLIYVLVGFRVS